MDSKGLLIGEHFALFELVVGILSLVDLRTGEVVGETAVQ